MAEQQNQSPCRFFVGVDGSQASEDAFQYVAKDLMRNETGTPIEDHLICGSITDKQKDTYLPWNMRSHYMKDAYEAKIVPLGKHGNFIAMERDESKTTKECLWNLAKEHKSDIIVVGNHGRKVPKKEETVCGSAIEYLSLNSFNPILIIKDYRPRTVKPDGCLRWGVCYDGSTRSKKALDHVLSMMRTTDKLAVI